MNSEFFGRPRARFVASLTFGAAVLCGHPAFSQTEADQPAASPHTGAQPRKEATPAGSPGQSGTPALTSAEQRFLDPRIDPDLRTVMNEAIGHRLPALASDLAWHNVDIAPDSWDQFRGKVIVLQSWNHATENGRAAPRRVAALLEKLASPDVRLVALHTPDGAEQVKTFLDRSKLTLAVLVDRTGAFCDDLGIWKTPVTIVIDRAGAVRYPGVSISALPQAVEKLLGEPFDAAAPAPPPLPARDARDAARGAPPAAAPTGDGSNAKDASATPEGYPPITGQLPANDLRGRNGPALTVGQWMNGRPQTEGKVVMVEFWATWCGPCVQNIPHLNELQEKFKDDVVIIGVTDEPNGTVQSFMRKHPFKYTVATDQKRRMASVVNMRGIPHAIVMSPNGIVRWQGHPAGLKEETLRQIVRAAGRVGKPQSSVKRWIVPSGRTE